MSTSVRSFRASLVSTVLAVLLTGCAVDGGDASPSSESSLPERDEAGVLRCSDDRYLYLDARCPGPCPRASCGPCLEVGDGRCHRRCAADLDCGFGATCRGLGLYQGTDYSCSTVVDVCLSSEPVTACPVQR